MKRYLLFTFDTYYPLGGWQDFFGAYDSLSEAMDAALDIENRDNIQIVDTQTMKIVRKGQAHD